MCCFDPMTRAGVSVPPVADTLVHWAVPPSMAEYLASDPFSPYSFPHFVNCVAWSILCLVSPARFPCFVSSLDDIKVIFIRLRQLRNISKIISSKPIMRRHRSYIATIGLKEVNVEDEMCIRCNPRIHQRCLPTSFIFSTSMAAHISMK